MLTSCLTAVKKHVVKYCEKVYGGSGKNLFWSMTNSGEVSSRLEARDFNATSLSACVFSALYTALPRGLIGDKLVDLVEGAFQREGSPCLSCDNRNAFFTSEGPRRCHAWSCWSVCDALAFFDGQHFYSIWHRALWAGGWDSCGRWLCSPGCGFVPVLLWEGLYGVSF